LNNPKSDLDSTLAPVTQRLAVIDVGSNSIRLAVGVVEAGRIRVVDEDRVVTRLGRLVDGRLDQGAAEDSLAAVRNLIDRAGDADLRLIATASIRDAKDGQAFIDQLERHVDVLTPKREAELALRSAAEHHELAGRCGIIDIGGGSTEIIIAVDGVTESMHLLPLGVVRLTQSLSLANAASDSVLRELQHVIQQELGSVTAVETAIGTGGAFTALAALVLGEPEADLHATHRLQGFAIASDDVRRLLKELAASDAPERAAGGEITIHRAEILLAGAALADSVLEALGVDSVTVHEPGIRLGLLAEMVDASC
jgi:exopolyphosphatase/guanosine-5'-triphosphate,3'-diphosphate pyrophosphatase